MAFIIRLSHISSMLHSTSSPFEDRPRLGRGGGGVKCRMQQEQGTERSSTFFSQFIVKFTTDPPMSLFTLSTYLENSF